ncbi:MULTISPECIES: MSHA biogenesis protein MshF [Vibrio]|uniref:MSHA biogenesis protein MshF n=1 Tax=Vibrio ostreae TaxID=2841925 RepID=A0A975U9T2_9VIBR|nr:MULTISPECIES: MSHA biogenesis protein MshF [Vibrio]QXO17112.1 MSHA biogenesis protein MshF [Vibrio ostreae]WGY48573.1 MSHA biogenesis protein MshF [Vibrio sp. ABG19]
MLTQRSGLILWALVVLSLIAVMFSAWQPINRELQRTAFEVASGRMIERANFYKQEWLLRGQPQRSEIDGEWMTFSPHGWLYPRLDGEGAVDCNTLLAQLYPQVTILNQPPRVTGTTLSNGYECVFEYHNDNTIEIRLQNNRFSAKIRPQP